MIRIGLSKPQKVKLVKDYLDKNEIKNIIVLNTNQHDIRYNFGMEAEYVEYDEWEMYRTFYPLLERIDKHTLLIVDEPFRTKNFGDLKYNCGVVFCNQTPHKIIFSTFPIIKDAKDFMILMKFEKGQKNFVEKFDYILLQAEDIQIRPRKIKMNLIFQEISEKDRERYEKKKDKLFDNLGNKDPNTIPRSLQLFVGDLKKKLIEKDKMYIARNGRFKLDNVETYRNYDKKANHIILDYHYSDMVMMDYFIDTGISKFDYISTGLSIDTHIVNEFSKWKARCDAFYAQANIYR